MNPFVPSPDVLPIPAPAPLFEALLHLTFLVHLLFMNALLGGGAILLASLSTRGGDRELHETIVERISKLLPTLFAGTVTFGVAPLLFLQTLYGGFFYTSSILMGWPWFATVPLLIVGYYAAYLNAFRGRRLGGGRRWAAGVAVGCVALVGFAFSNNTTLMLTPEKWGRLYFASPGGLHLNLGEALLWPRFLHMVLGAIAVAGLLLALLAKRERADARLREALVRRGLDVFLGATAVNVMVGFWYLLALREDVRRLFMGGSGHATGLLGLGAALSLVLLLLAWRVRAVPARSLKPLSWAMLLTMAVMILMRDAARAGYLAGLANLQEIPVRTQALNLAIFAVLLLGGIATVVWMVRRLLAAPPR